MSIVNAGPPPSVTQAQIDIAERLARQHGLTYLSTEGYAKLAALLAHVMGPSWFVKFDDSAPIVIQGEVNGWRVG